MAGIRVPQYDIFKVGTDKLKYSNWDITLDRREAFKYQELVSLFEAQEFRIIANKILNQDISTIDFSEIFLQVVVEKKMDFARATSKKGVVVNGIRFRRFIGTTGGLKNDTLLFCNTEYLDRLNELCECKRNKEVKLVPAKYEAYKALTCSASQPICEPNGILVVHDCATTYQADVINLDDGVGSDEPIMNLIEGKTLVNNASDGFNLCTPSYMQRVSQSLGLDYVPGGVCLRNAWLKGMMYPFDIVKFCEEYNNQEYIVTDIWGEKRDIRDCDMIVTESSFKLWNAYDSIEDYVEAYRECGYEFAVTKIAPRFLEEQREVNYQYLQSYDFTDEDIEELCEPTIRYLKDSMGGTYEDTIKFLGITEDTEVNSWQRALYTSRYMLNDPYVIDSIQRFIKKKINDAKIGKLFVDGNYQIASGDPFSLMQSVCGLPVTGLLSAGECYSNFWETRNEKEIIIFRSPMTSHNNIRKCRLHYSSDCDNWYQYMDTILIINSWDSFCMAANGSDYDSDILFSTNNAVLKRRYRELPAIECVQRNGEKVFITEGEIRKSNKNGMGNQVGTITNYVTSMMEVQAKFLPGTREYKELEYRIACGQLYQQASLDKIKGIVTTPMPSRWYNLRACGKDKFLRSICAYRKPYFMIYVYDRVKRKYKKYLKEVDIKCQISFNCTVEELQRKENRNKEEDEFLYWYELKMPVGDSNCSMNRICHYVERELDGYKNQLKKESTFDYEILKTGTICEEENISALLNLEKYYCSCVNAYKKNISFNKSEARSGRHLLYKKVHETAKEICPDDGERLNIVLDMTYRDGCNRQFCWDVIGDLICQRLEEMECIY